jgi:hypothetical protein
MLIRQFGFGIAAVVVFSTAVFGQSSDTPYQIRYFGYLNNGDSFINLSNTGASSTVAVPQNGAICVNLYAISPDTHALVGCCSCAVAANALKSVNVTADLLGGTANIPPSNSVVVKSLASVLSVSGLCNAGTVGTGANVLDTGMLVWGTSIRPLPKDTVTTTTISSSGTQISGPTPISTSTKYGPSVIRFSPSTLSAPELFTLTNECALKPVTTCGSCKVGAQ